MKLYLRLLAYLKPYTGKLIVAVIAMLIFTVLQSVSIMTLVPLVDKVFNNTQVTIPSGVAFIPMRSHVDRVIAYLNTVRRYPNMLNMIVTFVLILTFFKGIAEYLHEVMLEYVGQGVVKDMRNQLYGHIQGLSMEYFDKKRTGELVSRINYDVSLILEALSGRFAKSLMDCIQLPAYAIIALCIQWELAVITMIGLPFLLAPIGVVGRKVRRLTRAAQEKVADISSILFETISGIQVVKAFCMEGYEGHRFKRENRILFRVSVAAVKKAAILSPITEWISMIVVAFLLYYGARLVIKEELTISWFCVFLAMLAAMIKPIKNIGKLNVGLQKALSAADRIFQLLDTKSSMVEKPGAIALPRISRGVNFDRVSFEYASGDTEVLRDISLDVRAGEIIAIVGPSGSGKTSLVSLIPRFYDPTGGCVRIDGIDIRDVTVLSVRGQLGIVTQETILFNDTVRNNIAYGQQDAPFQKIVEAATMANAHDFISALPKGYDAFIGEKGEMLSGGERQRLAIGTPRAGGALQEALRAAIRYMSSRQIDILKERILRLALRRGVAPAIYLLARSIRLHALNDGFTRYCAEQGKSCIFSFWHNRLLLMPYIYGWYRGRKNMCAMTSRSRDGGYMSEVLQGFGFEVVRGSSSSGGQWAAMGMAARIDAGLDAAIVPDGPRGPRYVAQPGAIWLSQMTGAPIVPATYDMTRKIRLKSWDRFMVPVPFSRGVLIYGDPIFVPMEAGDEERERLRGILESALLRLNTEAAERLGVPCT
ncbi:MAG: ABC transporter transmembrane domain-containing protein [Candidatus Aureabacteria bacterium]|nr:ABC transporter transmembrane domain-containing protein [Candidatus Auribacterota bacterium]